MKLGKLKPFQESAVSKILPILKSSSPNEGKAAMLIGKPGSGKTFIAGEIIEQLLPWLEKNHPYYKISRIPILYVTAAAVVRQTQDELLNRFNIPALKIKVISYSSLISNEGSIFCKKVYPEGYDPTNEEHLERMGRIPADFEWIPFVSPLLIVLDESQRTRKSTSAAYRCIKGAIFNTSTMFLFMSGTPFQTPMEAETFGRAVNLRQEARRVKEFNRIAYAITAPNDPYSLSPAGMKKFMDAVDHAVIRLPNIRTKFHNHLKIQLVDFLNHQEKEEYDRAFEDYVKQCIACRKSTNFGRKAKLVAQNKFRQRAEAIKAKLIAKIIHEQRQQGFAPTLACEYQTTIVKVVIELVKTYGYKRDDIAIIWGGGQKFTALKKQYTPEEIYTIFAKALSAPEELSDSEKDDIDEIHKQIEQTGMDIVEDLQDPTLRLGPQSDEMREEEKQCFQSGKAQICLYTFKTGSVGLSLHHCVDYFETRPLTYRCKAGTEPEDMEWEYVKTGLPVPYKPLPRRSLLSPTWDAIEWIQAIGRPHRLTSLSDTIQCGLYYRGTIEEKVAMIAAPKLKNMAVVVAQKDAWMDAIDISELEALMKEQGTQHNIGGITQTIGDMVSEEVIELEQEGEER